MGGVEGDGGDEVGGKVGEEFRAVEGFGDGDGVGVTPTVAFAEPEERCGRGVGMGYVGEPGEVLVEAMEAVRVDVGGIGVLKDEVGVAGVGFGYVDAVVALHAVEIFGGDLAGVGDPVHVGNVVLAGITGEFEPGDDGWLIDIDDADAHGAVGRAGLGIMIGAGDGNGTGGFVDESPLLDAGLIELPESDGAGIGAPAKAVADVELFFVDPVGGAVDDVVGAVEGEGEDAVGGESFDVDIVVANVSDGATVG